MNKNITYWAIWAITPSREIMVADHYPTQAKANLAIDILKNIYKGGRLEIRPVK